MAQPAGADRTARAPGAVREVMANRWDRIALASVLAGVIVRIIWGLVIHPPFDYLYSDMGAYVERAQRLAAGAGLQRSDAFFPPGTHILLAAPMTLFGTERAGLWVGAMLWCALSAAIPLLAWRLARLLLTPAAAALTALFCAFWPLYITYGGYFTSETPSLAFLLASLWAGYRAGRLSGSQAGWLGLAAGLLGGVAVANRPQLILNLAVLVVPLLFRIRRQTMALTGIVAGSALILAGTALHNSAAAGKPTGLSENAGLNFWIGHCDVHDVTTTDPVRNITFQFGNPVWTQLGRGGTYYFEGPLVWDQGFFYEMGVRCIERDGLGHVRVLARNVMNMSATTVPWPQVNEDGQRGVVRLSNLAYSLLLPLIVIDSVFVLVRRPASGRSSGEAVILLQLACALLVAIFFFGDPRVRSSYDVFGLALLAARVADRFGLEESRGKPAE
ncbi:MAG: glycosyltransferase family 39 protein [Actinomycetota bacterium]|nr:glycosyltransferase family 39 protein [Actinomycetota bacterium]